jgi:hypothetical protein
MRLHGAFPQKIVTFILIFRYNYRLGIVVISVLATGHENRWLEPNQGDGF